MRRAPLILIVLLFLGGLVAAVEALRWDWRLFAPDHPPTSTIDDASYERRGPSTETGTPNGLAALKKTLAPAGTTRNPGFDVARINPDGASVFAGHAVPNSSVTVFADGVSIGLAPTDENGDWVLVTERAIPSKEPSLSLEIRAGAADVGRSGLTSHAARAEVGPEKRTSPANSNVAAAKVTADLIENLRQLVERARKRNAKHSARPRDEVSQMLDDVNEVAQVSQPNPTSVALKRASEAPKIEGAKPDAKGTTSQVRHPFDQNDTGTDHGSHIPVPIKFVFNEAVLTDEGHQAARLLVEYVMLEKFASLRLTGHADERGTHDYNLALSAERLKTIASMLRAAGYGGELDLVPMGEKAPFLGVDRNSLSREILYELDRRVELRNAVP